MASITIVTEAGEERYPLQASPVTLGRGLESDVRVKDIKASRRHCQIVKTPQGFQIMDLSSGNGTYVNGVQVKQQMLAPGDKIQIGSTTLTFVDGQAAPKPAAPRPSEAKTAPAPSAVAATARLEAAPPAGKSTSLRAVSQTPQTASPGPATPSARPGPSGSGSVRTTGQIAQVKTPRPAASATSAPREEAPGGGPPSRSSAKLRGSTSVKKTGPGRPTRAGRTAGSRPDAAKPKPKPRALKVLLLAGAVVVLGGGAFFLFARGAGDLENLPKKVKKLEADAVAARKALRFDEARGKWQSLVEAIEGNDKFKSKKVEAENEIRELKALAGAEKRFADFKAKVARMKEGEAAELAKQGRDLYELCGGEAFAWLGELKETNDRLEKSAGPDQAAKGIDFQSFSQQIEEKCKMSTPAPDYGRALAEWQSFLADKKTSEENRKKAQDEIRRVQEKAREEASKLKSRAMKMADENKKAEAIEEIKNQRPRFKDTAAADDLEAILRELEK